MATSTDNTLTTTDEVDDKNSTTAKDDDTDNDVIKDNQISILPLYLSSPNTSSSVTLDQITQSTASATDLNMVPSVEQTPSIPPSKPDQSNTTSSSPTPTSPPNQIINHHNMPISTSKPQKKPTSSSPSYLTPLRLRKGTRLEDAYPSPFSDGNGPDPSTFLQSIESPFQVQEYIALLVRADPHDVERIVNLPSPSSQHPRKSSGQTLSNSSSAPLVPQEVWVYEQLRRFSQDLSHPFVSSLQLECARSTCPEMKAGEWLYLCAAHATANENDCCAIDYIVHTLDGATALLNSARYFPSRLQIPGTSIKHFTSIARRLYRIFAHAWFHHRDIFEQCETETSLYARFLALTDRFSLISEDLLVIPRTDEDDEQQQPQDDEDDERFANNKSQQLTDDDELEELE